MPEILLVRHAESDANVSGAWQGRGDSPLSPKGRSQVEALTRRMAGRTFDTVVSSPLIRALETAAAFADQPGVDPELIEIDLGTWEGEAFEVVAGRDSDLLAAIYSGSDDRFGSTGERLSEVAARAWAVIDGLAEDLERDECMVVVTHGGVIDALVASFLPTVSRRPHRMASNASLTHLVGRPGRWRLARFNDTTHLGKLPDFAAGHLESGGSVLALIRHGRTQANVERRMQGQSCWGLDDVGRDQATRLADWYGRLAKVYSSPLDRALTTARAVCTLDPEPVEGLQEIGLGDWEGLHWEEVVERWPDEVRRIFEEGEDLPRGGRGETWRAMTERMMDTIESLDPVPGEVTGVVSHGGAIRAFVGALGGVGPATPLHTPDNTSVTHIALTDNGPVLCDYAVAPHLEEMALAT